MHLLTRIPGVQRIGSLPPHYRHKSEPVAELPSPGRAEYSAVDWRSLPPIETNLECPEARWRIMGGASENWRWKKNLKFTPRLRVDEKTVEKLIARDCGECWVNQVPTASGLLDGTSETHCNIDLVCRVGENSYEFIELKEDDSTPLFAAFEAIKYLMLFVVSRRRRDELKYSIERNPLLWANSVRTVVLAPPQYYDRFGLKWLEEELILALSTLSNANLTLEFTFERMDRLYDEDAARAIQTRRRVYGCS